MAEPKTKANNIIKRHKKALREGLKDGIPIGLGYLAVSFSLGIAARKAGLNPLQGFVTSALINASAGEYAGFVLIAENATYLELAVMTFVANIRYLLMSCALSQKFSPNAPLRHRLLVGFDVTDEIFGVTIARPGVLDPYYSYGTMLVATPCWATGTAIGIIAGNLLPAAIVSALSVALYGMFIAVIIPQSRKDKIVAVLVAVSFAASFAFSAVPAFSGISAGTKTLILTVVISAAAALLFPLKKEAEEIDA